MNIPHTPGGRLKSMLSKMEDGLNFISKVRYTEDLGSTMEDLLAVDPWKSMKCEREECFPCQTQPGKCWNQSVTYQIDCLNCQTVGKSVRYYGESARTGFDRGLEHIKAIS